MAILLIRHAESSANADHNVYNEMADHTIRLTDKGLNQAKEVGVFINDFFRENPAKRPVRLWCSPYVRTTQTMLVMRDNAPDVTWDVSSGGRDVHFDERLREREWGAFQFHDYKKEGGSNRMLEEDPFYHAHFFRVWDAPQGRYFFRPKGGESVADVAERQRSFFRDLYFDIDRGVTDHVIVMHGLSMMAFTYAFTKAHPIFFDGEELGGNTCVRLLDKNPKTGHYNDYGFIYEPDRNLYLLNKPQQPILRDINDKLEAFLK